MRRFITLTTIALSTLFAAPVLASPGGPGNGPGNHASNATGHNGNAGAYGHHDDSGGPAHAPGMNTPGYATPAPVFHPKPLQVLTAKELRKAQALERSYSRQRASLLRQLRVAEKNLEILQHRRAYRPAAVRAAKAKIFNLQKKVASLDFKYRQSLARFLTPVQVRYFLALS